MGYPDSHPSSSKKIPNIMSHLTIKEKTVLSLVSSGLTTKEIADALNISHHTVESHRKNLLRKCRAKNSAELVQKSFTTMDSRGAIIDPT
ncbi:MAG: helix-turn-helix transcriptional regulator [Cyclobacteriaceae bacterium]